MKIYKIIILAFTLCFQLFASLEPIRIWNPIVPNKIEDKFNYVTQQKIDGLLGYRINVNLEKRLLQIDSSILLSGFKKRPGSQVWIGEHVGKFLFSASLTYKYTRDPRLKQLMDEMVTKYISYQLEDGYIGTYLPKDYWSEWDVWAHKYCIIGLLNYYSITGDKRAIECAKKAADLICKTFGELPGQRDLITSGHHVGMAAGSILEPMIDLYRYTNDEKYLNFAKYILKAWEQPNGPHIVSNLEKYGKVTTVGNAKAYEMMSCFVGIAKYYKLTGDEKYYKVLQTAWTDIRLNRMYITGTASDHEHFKEEDILFATNEDHMGEGCVTTTWIQFNQQLFLISGEIKYVEEMERAVYNHLFAAENPQTGCVSYYTALIGVKPHKCDQGFSCCLSSIPRGISMIPEMIWGKLDGKFTMLFYESGDIIDTIKAEGKKMRLRLVSQTDFPFEGRTKILVSIAEKKKFTLAFRVPNWCKNYTAKIGNDTYNAMPGEILQIERKWSPGDAIVINFDIPLQIIPGGKSYPNSVAIKRGPQVLAVDAQLNRQLGSIYYLDLNATETFNLMDGRNSLPEKWSWRQAYFMPINIEGKIQTLVLVPFSEAGQYGTDVSVWLKKSNVLFK
ncbi:MAG: glycoside hydrolase family 127 protein [Bacteroidota bacterium]|nr:glycoside hydrolase family 127 protein [Bacteroidota bacterium]